MKFVDLVLEQGRITLTFLPFSVWAAGPFTFTPGVEKLEHNPSHHEREHALRGFHHSGNSDEHPQQMLHEMT
jgi:hypothetical protein